MVNESTNIDEHVHSHSFEFEDGVNKDQLVHMIILMDKMPQRLIRLRRLNGAQFINHCHHQSNEQLNKTSAHHQKQTNPNISVSVKLE